jgi:glycosyltransferase involved in cell wall biosynthesis
MSLKGGPATFMRNIKNEFDRLNISTVDSFNKSRNIFFPIEYNLDELKYIKKKNGQIIQRLDGIYYPEKHGDKFKSLNSNIEEIYKNYSSFIIFQSNYSKKQCEAMFGKAPQFEIIYNGANLDIFFPPENKVKEKKVKFITTGNFRNIDMLEPVVLALDSFRKVYDFELNILGPFSDNSLKRFLNRDYINYLGETSNQVEIATFLREADVFIYSHLNPPCPNSVIEAISCALPVIGFNSGALNELCYFNLELLADVSDDIFQKYESFSPAILAGKIQLYFEKRSYFDELSLMHCREYSIDKCVENYLRVFEKLDIKEVRNSVFEKLKELIR